jgi:hypothetical protein
MAQASIADINSADIRSAVTPPAHAPGIAGAAPACVPRAIVLLK